MLETKKARLHVSWLIMWVCSGLIIGIAAVPLVGLNLQAAPLIIIGLSFAVASLISKSRKAFIFAVLAGLILGLVRGSTSLQLYNEYQQFYGEEVLVTGVVAEDTSLDASGKQKIKLKNVTVNDTELNGTIWISASDQSEIKRSDNLKVTGYLNEGFGNFPASIFQAEVVNLTRTKHADIALEVRDWFSQGVREVINEPEASLGLGFLTGQNSTLPEDLSNNLRLLGLTHIVVASGYNLTILVRFCRRGFSKISKYWATMSSLFLISGFVLVTGFSPSMNRAALITGLSIIAWHYGRRIHPVVLLSFAAGLTAFINPGYVWGDLGWYLSFAAFAGVIILAPLIYHYFWGDKKKPGSLHQILLETISAQIMTAPIIALAFSQFAPLALPANLLVLIFIPAAMIATFIAGVSGLLSFGIEAFSLPAKLILSYITLVVDKLSLLPIALAEIDFKISYLIISYTLILLAILYMWRRTKHDFLRTSVVE